MNTAAQKFCIASGPLGFLLFGIGIWPLAHFLPPLPPSGSAADIAAVYAANPIGIRLGAGLVMFGASFFMPFFAMMSVIMRRIEGPVAPWAVTQLIGAAVVIICFFIGPMIFTMAAFRPDRAPELTQSLNDAGWIMLVTPSAPAFVQTLAIGFAVLGDRRPIPLLPRWSGYLSIWVAVLFIPGALAMMFKTGPFAWNGLLAFWVPAGLVGVWANIFAWLMMKAVDPPDGYPDAMNG